MKYFIIAEDDLIDVSFHHTFKTGDIFLRVSQFQEYESPVRLIGKVVNEDTPRQGHDNLYP